MPQIVGESAKKIIKKTDPHLLLRSAKKYTILDFLYYEVCVGVELELELELELEWSGVEWSGVE
jgi:hypothetical protein